MVKEPTAAENKNDDLDLLTLLERIFSFLRKYGKLLVISSVAGVLTGLMLYIVLPKQYSSTLLLHSFTLTNTEHINIIENWNQLLKKDEYEALGKELNCDPGLLKDVSKISASEIQKLYIQNNPNGFMVEVIVKDTAVLDPLQQGIVTGLENGEYIKAKLESRKSNLRQLIEKLKIEISKLDSTKRDIERSVFQNGKNSSSYILDISGITGQIINLNEKLLSSQDELKFTHAVQVYHNFAKFKKPSSPQLFKLLVLGFIGGFAVGYVLAMYRYVRRRTAQHHTHTNIAK